MVTGLVSDGFPASVSLAVVDGEGTASSSPSAATPALMGEMVPTAPETLYDLASLTKVVCTVTLALVAQQHVEPGLPYFAKWLSATPSRAQRYGTCYFGSLTAVLQDMHGALRGPSRGRCQGAGGRAGYTDVLYSDLNYMLLGWVLDASGKASMLPSLRRSAVHSAFPDEVPAT